MIIQIHYIIKYSDNYTSIYNVIMEIWWQEEEVLFH